MARGRTSFIGDQSLINEYKIKMTPFECLGYSVEPIKNLRLVWIFKNWKKESVNQILGKLGTFYGTQKIVKYT